MQWRYRSFRIAVLLSLLAVGSAPAAAQDALVLGGGGSRGLAHAGALAGLTRKGFRPDLVVGSSMGAIMGALYAAGVSPDSIWRLSRRVDWQEVFAFPHLRALPEAEAPRPFLNLGLGVDRRRYAEGVVVDRNVNRLLVSLLFDAGARAQGDFDRLPIPFRSVAADLATGTTVSLAGGDLARAVRASMSVPGVFAPVIDDQGRFLVDGGLADYLPVKAARAAGARRVVAVDVIRPPAASLGRLNPFQVGLRAFRLTLHNARPDGPPADITIEPDIDPNLTAAIFLRDATPLLEAGLEAALRQFPDSLAHRGDSGQPGGSAAAASPSSFGALRIRSNDPALAPVVEHAFAHIAGAPYQASEVLHAADRLYTTGYFSGIWPSIDADGNLVVRAEAQPPVLLSASFGYDDDRGVRGLASVRARRGTGEFTLASRLGSLRSWAALTARRPLTRLPALAPAAGILYRKTDVRAFEGERVASESAVRRIGGWAGLVWTGRREAAEIVTAFRTERIDTGEAGTGTATGFSIRLAGREPNARVVGTPPVLEFQRRWGDIAWSEVRASAAFDLGSDGVRTALVADLVGVGKAAPADAMPALGDDSGVPGLRYGSRRGSARAIAGLDVAIPIFFEGYARLRLRSGAIAGAIDKLGEVRWTPGADVSLVWWSPFGRFAVGVGATRGGDWRASFDIGPRF
jgi:predicted acylesterase/phospholipase RssA